MKKSFVQIQLLEKYLKDQRADIINRRKEAIDADWLNEFSLNFEYKGVFYSGLTFINVMTGAIQAIDDMLLSIKEMV